MFGTKGFFYSNEAREHARGAFLFVFKLFAISLVAFFVAYWGTRGLFSFFRKDSKLPPNTYEGFVSNNNGDEEIRMPVVEASDNTLPVSFSDLFSSLVFIASTSPEVEYDVKKTLLSLGSFPGGLRPNDSLFITSKNINSYDGPVVRAMITEVDISKRGVEAQWFLSNDGIYWFKAPIGEYVSFRDSSATKLFWRAEISPGSSDTSSFSLDRIRLDYRVRI